MQWQYLNLLPSQIRGSKQQLVNRRAVWRSEDNLVRWAFLLGHDYLPTGGIVSIREDKLLLSRGGWLKCCDDLDLLASLLISYNLSHSKKSSINAGQRRTFEIHVSWMDFTAMMCQSGNNSILMESSSHLDSVCWDKLNPLGLPIHSDNKSTFSHCFHISILLRQLNDSKYTFY